MDSTISQHDQKEKWNPEDIVPEDFNEKNEETQQKSARKIINFVISFIFSLIIGSYSGLRSRDLHEAFVFTALFASEAFVCEIIAKIIPFDSFKESMHRYGILFIITSSLSLICYFINSYLGGDLYQI